MRIGIDLGGTTTEAIALERSGREIARRRLAMPQGHCDGAIRAIQVLVRTIEDETGERDSVGVAIPGPLSPQSGLVKNANSTCLIGKPPGKALARPVRLANDAGCFALSEAIDGAGQAMDHEGQTGESRGVGGLDTQAIHTLAEERDAAAENSLGRYERRLAKDLASVINILDPDIIVLGGGLPNMSRLYRNVPRLWQGHVHSDHVSTRLLPARQGGSSGVRGAARLWPEATGKAETMESGIVEAEMVESGMVESVWGEMVGEAAGR